MTFLVVSWTFISSFGVSREDIVGTGMAAKRPNGSQRSQEGPFING